MEDSKHRLTSLLALFNIAYATITIKLISYVPDYIHSVMYTLVAGYIIFIHYLMYKNDADKYLFRISWKIVTTLAARKLTKKEEKSILVLFFKDKMNKNLLGKAVCLIAASMCVSFYAFTYRADISFLPFLLSAALLMAIQIDEAIAYKRITKELFLAEEGEMLELIHWINSLPRNESDSSDGPRQF